MKIAAEAPSNEGMDSVCLGVPGRVVDIEFAGRVPMAIVDFGGISRTACLAYAPEARPGDYVIVHAGFAVSVVDRADAARSYALLTELATEPAAGADVTPLA